MFERSVCIKNQALFILSDFLVLAPVDEDFGGCQILGLPQSAMTQSPDHLSPARKAQHVNVPFSIYVPNGCIRVLSFAEIIL